MVFHPLFFFLPFSFSPLKCVLFFFGVFSVISIFIFISKTVFLLFLLNLIYFTIMKIVKCILIVFLEKQTEEEELSNHTFNGFSFLHIFILFLFCIKN